MFKLGKFAATSQIFGGSRRYFSSKVVRTVEEALEGLKDGDTVLAGGFGLSGNPENLIKGILDKGTKNLTVVSNNCGTDKFGLGILLNQKRIKRMISSYVGENAEMERQYLSGELELELVPQGTLAEKMRAGGAGIPAFYTPTGANTLVELGGFPIKVGKDGKPVIVSERKPRETFDGKDYIRERSIRGDFAIVKAMKADTKGNLIFHKTARNFNQDAATAGKICVAEVEEIVEAGQIDPDQVHLPGIYVQRVFKGDSWVKPIEKTVYDTSDEPPKKDRSRGELVREKIAKRACKEISNGMYINLGIGIPVLIPRYLDPGVQIELHSENGVLGVGNYPKKGQEHPDLINAGKETITVNPGASFFSSSQSFAMIRGKHLDMTILGGMQVDQKGDLANWIIPGKLVKGMGGAMDLVSAGSKVMVVMEHTAKGAHKILKECALPITGKGIVDVLITEMAVFRFVNGEMILEDIAEGLSLEDIKKNTGAEFKVKNNLGTF
eukprot:CAMPEP_0176425152 /NCGR_PEP_ID=MMETSP0127-20121128/11236_1 /TAXON_ID=938130 /ORGANISM="Platyophrya macrostoma, Strain WH" /LENGTH=495 /DNA_ID=CAMNT_0017806293 /DNA_START=44 /DNA_END=1531 /DNA_ORIENTATION=+